LGGEQEAEMHALFFGMKRAHHATLRLSRSLLRGSGLTPARFDMMYAIRQQPSLLQSTLRRRLGVSRTTVSRMLQALEQCGFVRRARAGRERLVEMTREGALTFVRAERAAVLSGAVSLALDAALAPITLDAFVALEAFDGHLQSVRVAFGDAADLLYPWHPDD
jgi:DNA-binding MarR family transcriptional regulator